MRLLPQSATLRKFALSHFLLELQFWFPVWMLFLTHRGFDLTTMVLADGVFRTTMTTLEFPLGVFSDRIGRKKTYILISLLAVLTYAGIIMVNGSVLLFSVWILWGVFWALSSGAASAYCYELLVLENKEDQSFEIFGFIRAVASAAALVSHLAAGFLFSIAPELPFVANGLLALAAFALAFTLPKIKDAKAGARRGAQTFRAFLTIPRQNTAIFASVLLLALALIYFWSPRILMQPLFLELDISPSLISVVYFFYSLAGVLAGLAAGRIQKRVGNRISVFGGIGLIWLGVILVALTPGRSALLFFPLLSFGFYIAHTLLEVLLHRELENRFRASILSAVSFFASIFIIFTRPGLGMLADWRDTPFAFMVWAVLGLGILAASGYLVRRLPEGG